MEIADLRPSPSERLMIVGATGTGKTTLARELLRGYDAVLVIDPKCTYDPQDDEYIMIRSPAGLNWRVKKKKKIHFRPEPGSHTVAAYDAVYRWAYHRQDIMVYTDETYLTMHHTISPDWQRAVVTCGRELNVGAIFATQRPSGIDVRIISESERKAAFYLDHRDDRKRMSESMGDKVMEDPEAVSGMEHAFWYCNRKARSTKLACLNLGGETSGV